MSHIKGPDGEYYDIVTDVIQPSSPDVTMVNPTAAQDEQPKKEQGTAPSAMMVDTRTQMIVASNNSELMRIIKVFMKGNALPKSLDTEAKVIAAWQMAASLRIPPAIAIQNMAFVNGTISMWGQLPKALAQSTGELEDFVLRRIDDKHNVICLDNKNLNAEHWGTVITIKRKGQSSNEFYFTMDDAKRAGLDGKKGPWQEYTPIMIDRRASAYAIKTVFPDALMGIPVAEYDHDQAPDLKDITPSETKESFNDKIKAALSGSPQTETL